MNSLDVIKNKPWLVSLICTIFLLYPNIAWFMCDLSFVEADEHLTFVLFFIFRALYILCVMWTLIVVNMRHLQTLDFLKRAAWNMGITLTALGAYLALTILTSFSYDNFVSIVVFQFIVAGLLGTMLGYIYLLYTSQREKEKLIEQLKIDNLQSRCTALMNQINPHFFFNALNGISALVRKNDNQKTLEYVDKLSDIFRYTIQSDSKTLVTLDEELLFVEAFRHVMEVRFANKFQIDINVEADRHAHSLPVLSLLPLLENAVVHNTIDSEHHLTISITLNEQGELVVSNPIFPKLTAPDTNGTGLKNLSNRFRMMMEKDIRVECNDNCFTVYLPLK